MSRTDHTSWTDYEKRLRGKPLLFLPVGAHEQHGPHLSLDTDAYHAEHLCREVAAACTPPRPLVLPLISYGVSYHHDEFPGTISISPGTLSQLTVDVGMSIARQGITKLIIVNGHGGNAPALHFAAQMINRDAHIFTCKNVDRRAECLAKTVYASAYAVQSRHSVGQH